MRWLLTIPGILYAGLLMLLRTGLFRHTRPDEAEPGGISIVIAARNEAGNLPRLIAALKRLDYPKDKFEVIIADDRSTDQTRQILEQYCSGMQHFRFFTICENLRGLTGKKNALTQAIRMSRYPVLALTDADCEPPSGWLRELNRYFSGGYDIVAGYSPIRRQEDTIWNRMMNLERLGLFAVAAGSLGWGIGLTTTGRNLAYRKSLFERTGGFSKTGHVPAGDDDLLLQQMAPCARKTGFMFAGDSVVPTWESITVKEMPNRETRRASLWVHASLAVKAIVVLAVVFYLSIGVMAIRCLISRRYCKRLFSMLLLKMLPEYLFLRSFGRRMEDNSLLKWYFPSQILYVPLFLFFMIRGAVSGYHWKGE